MVRQMDEHEQRSMMLKMLRDAPGWVPSGAIEERTMMSHAVVRDACMDLLSQGHPVCADHLDGSLFTEDADVSYRLARTPQDLSHMLDVVGEQLALCRRIKIWMQKAQARFALAEVAPRHHGTQ